MIFQNIKLGLLVPFFVLVGLSSNVFAQYKVPKGKDCENYFSKNAGADAVKEEMYISPKRVGFLAKNQEYGAVLQVVYTGGEVTVILKVTKDEAMCAKENAPLGIKFVHDNTAYVERGHSKENCIPGRLINKDKFAMTIHRIPINSLMFKRLLTESIEIIATETTEDMIIMAPLNAEHQNNVKNIFRCVYESVGNSVNLTNDSLLIQNAKSSN
jgi:hypothetical protein